ncbi:MAG: hypothetical protein LBJ89_02520 [Holosporales bacterium]|jgi:predicted DNA-binding protein|nr:hypothetical protein [Holosporales bacterium]
MPTKLQRINLSIEKDIIEDLELLASITQKTITGLAKELIIDALDRREDLYLSKLANEMDKEGTKTLSHEEFWT